jgi:hypothetical protein
MAPASGVPGAALTVLAVGWSDDEVSVRKLPRDLPVSVRNNADDCGERHHRPR